MRVVDIETSTAKCLFRLAVQVQGTSRCSDSVKEAPLRPQKWWKARR